MVQRMMNFDAQEQSRLSGQKLKIVQRLRQGPALNTELNSICYRYGARIFELRKAGFEIEKAFVEPGVFRYSLCSEPTQDN